MKTPNAVFITNNREAFDRNFNQGQLFTTLDLLQGAVEYFDAINSFLVVILDPSIEKDVKVYEEDIVPCNCEHKDHFTNNPKPHGYMDAPSGSQRAAYVGAVCDECARTHLKDYIVS